MIKRLAAFCVALLFSTAGIAQQCQLWIAQPIQPNTLFDLGPTMYAAAIAHPEIQTAVVNARDAWDQTNAINRIGNWSGVTTLSDCVAWRGSTVTSLQVGLLAFAGSTCPTVIANMPANPPPGTIILAFVDYYARSGCLFPSCATKSLSLNMDVAWTSTPGLDGLMDLQSVVTHEFGHVLGFAHMENGNCSPDPNTFSPTCATSPNRETMQRYIYNGEDCSRTIQANDISSANSLY